MLLWYVRMWMMEIMLMLWHINMGTCLIILFLHRHITMVTPILCMGCLIGCCFTGSLPWLGWLGFLSRFLAIFNSFWRHSWGICLTDFNAPGVSLFGVMLYVLEKLVLFGTPRHLLPHSPFSPGIELWNHYGGYYTTNKTDKHCYDHFMSFLGKLRGTWTPILQFWRLR